MTRRMAPGTGSSRAPESDYPIGPAAGAVAVVAGPVPGQDQIKDLLAQRLALQFPAGFDTPAHVRRVALAAPGDDGELFRVIAQSLERPLIPANRRWECWIVEGLQDERWAILITIGHDLAEHLSPAHLLARLCDQTDFRAFANPIAAKTVTPTRSPNAAEAIRQAAARAVNGLSAAAGALRTWPAGGRPPMVRRYRTVAVPRDAVDRIAGKFGVGADDVALAAITEGLRTVVLQRGDQPRADALRIVGTALTHLPVEHRDPHEQLRAVHGQVGARPAVNSPAALCASLLRRLTGGPRPDVVAVAATPPGPRYQLQLMGRQFERVLPIPPAAPEHDTAVAVLSYHNEMIFGITTGYDATPDILAAGIESGMARLVALSCDSVVLFDRRPKRRVRPLSNGAARWRPSPPPTRVRH